MALTRARLVWTSDAAFGAAVETSIEQALRRPRPEADLAGDIRRMRELMARERGPWGFWDLKLSRGGQIDAEFLAQFRQLQAAVSGGALTVSTLEALADDPEAAEAWRLQQGLRQLLACASDEDIDPEGEPEEFRQRLAAAVDCMDFETLKVRLIAARQAALDAFDAALPRSATEI
jgi:glutamate-ammonia-ligase adenylyltransferase